MKRRLWWIARGLILLALWEAIRWMDAAVATLESDKQSDTPGAPEPTSSDVP